MTKKSLIRVDHKRHSNAFFFQALFSALLLALAFLMDDLFNELIDESIHGSYKKYIKLSSHVLVIFVLSLILIYAFKWIFGWGDAFLG